MARKEHSYAAKAADLVEECLQQIRDTLRLDRRHRHHVALDDMEDALSHVERLLHAYFIQLIDIERAHTAKDSSEEPASIPSTLRESMAELQTILDAKRKQEETKRIPPPRRPRHRHSRVKKQHVTKSIAAREDDNEQLTRPMQSAGDSGDSSTLTSYYPCRSATDTLLFRLIVTLELCLVRIGDAHFVITGRRMQSGSSAELTSRNLTIYSTAVICLGTGCFVLLRKSRTHRRIDPSSSLRLTGVAAFAFASATVLQRKLGDLWMTAKVVKSTAALEEWQQQWLLVQSTDPSDSDHLPLGSSLGRCSGRLDPRSQRLIEHALSESPKSSFWHSEGEIRFLFLKRAMDLLYASIGTAVEVTKNRDAEDSVVTSSAWKVPLAAAAAASYYSLAGPSRRASQATLSSSSQDLIKYAWGMVSLPAIKQLSLKASRVLKGAAIAERIEIAGVPCFILSRRPFPDLAASVRRSQRKKERSVMKRLSTIYESDDATNCSSNSLSAGISRPSTRLEEKDVIFHLTGGGFFAHTIASDLPYLLDWSGKTGAVVICPEYALLPEHKFPVALKQILAVYTSIMSGEAAMLLGFNVRRLVVTGESAGGNLSAALLVKLITGHHVDVDTILAERERREHGESHLEVDLSNQTKTESLAGERGQEHSQLRGFVRLPDAIMLSCPALNLSLELSPSRVRGHQDPVLPSGLISAISDAYVPPSLGISKKDSLASPFYASDEVLRLFPPTLLFASSDDPLLDDSVEFNKRLRTLGVDSDLRAAHNMPHAYWGLGTAGFPEAMQVQRECEDWLATQLRVACDNE